VFLCNTDETPAKQGSYLDMLAAERVVGVILAPADPADETIGQLLDMQIPVVAFDREVADPRADAVTADNLTAGLRATELLLEHGHIHIGFIAGRPDIQTGSDRLRGYERAMANRSLESYAESGMFRVEGARAATKRLLTERPETTALVVGNNLMTVGTLGMLRTAGLAVPHCISLVQIDDPVWASLVDPPLTSFAQPVRNMAQSAIDMLLQRIRSERTSSKHIVYQFEPRLRESVRAMP
jgi:DNA-binding LacI/PurR family transcriptional regulator